MTREQVLAWAREHAPDGLSEIGLTRGRWVRLWNEDGTPGTLLEEVGLCAFLAPHPEGSDRGGYVPVLAPYDAVEGEDLARAVYHQFEGEWEEFV